MSSEDCFPSQIRPRRAALRWTRRRPLGWTATAFHGTYDISPSLRHHYSDGDYRLMWRRGDGFTVRYRLTSATDETHVPRVTTWFAGVAEAKDAVRTHHDALARANRAAKKRARPRRAVLTARAALRAARGRHAAFLQPSLRLPSPEDPP